MATIIRCCSSFSHTSDGRAPPRDRSRSLETGKSIGYSLVRAPGAYYPISKIKPLSTNPKERESKGVLQTPLGSVDDFDKLSAFEGIGRVKLPVMAVLFTNSLLMGTPLEALAAELCETESESSIFSMPFLLLVALVGATVGGLLARQRKGELQRLNEQLRQINAALRRQAKIESYAPGLSYAPAGARIPENEIIVEPKKHELISKLKTGKTFLRNQEPEKAFEEFKTALELAQNLRDPVEEKKAARGLGASLQRQGKYRDAIQYHNMVLAISKREGEDSGSTEAYGAIADCYTELGDLEKAGKYYDTYIARLETD
ncbi:protein FLUORESCENT IN BLUE LIGHT, chloroplastic-like isoform X2 [Brassica napus]|uniref:protein FLUORESCENT IN BLUE LIGHT, chloroplastic-like isoform X2 n=1 Tax=Brassica napus TaxID=3708 RepID=UPI0020791B25|nr:protein FLUORESCENT IN BLUE LIGHT, chloroplastic-like isoform X2 [Brassica napus]